MQFLSISIVLHFIGMKLSKLRGIFFFVLTKTSIFVPELSETAELAKAVNWTGPFTSRKY